MKHVRREVFKIDRSELIGERLRVDGRISRTGIQIYKDSLGGSRHEYRPPEEVFSEDALSSLRSIPITIQHPSTGMVTRDNYRRLNVGHVGDDPRKDDDDVHVIASLWILDGGTIKKVQDGELTELSVGYWAALEETSGVTPEGEHFDAIQRDIQGNHLALLKDGQARGGRSVKMILDSNNDAIMPEQQRKQKETAMVKIRIDDLDFEVEDKSLAQAVKKEQKSLTQRADQSEAERDELQAKLDALTAEKEELQAKLDDATDPEKVQARAEARAKLINDARQIAPELDCKGTDHDIRKAALEAASFMLSLDSEGYVLARFEAALEAAPKDKKNDSLANVRKSISVQQQEKTKVHAGVHLDRGLSR